MLRKLRFERSSKFLYLHDILFVSSGAISLPYILLHRSGIYVFKKFSASEFLRENMINLTSLIDPLKSAHAKVSLRPIHIWALIFGGTHLN